jgi:hypothetical protein
LKSEFFYELVFLLSSSFTYFFFIFTVSLIWFGGQFWHKWFQPPPNRSCGGSNRGSPYQVRRQSPMNQLMILNHVT